MDELRKDVKENPQNYTYWLKIALGRMMKLPN